ncbi:MAG: hypothetical protein ABIR00_00615 [Nitrosospira sp.]
MIAAIGAKLIQDGLLVFLADFAITSSNGFQIFTPATFYHIKVSFSVTHNMAQRYFLKYLSVTFNVAQFEQVAEGDLYLISLCSKPRKVTAPKTGNSEKSIS